MGSCPPLERLDGIRRDFVMKVLVACEYSGRIRDALIALGIDAMSCDILPTEVPGHTTRGM